LERAVTADPEKATARHERRAWLDKPCCNCAGGFVDLKPAHNKKIYSHQWCRNNVPKITEHNQTLMIDRDLDPRRAPFFIYWAVEERDV
jgi:hypothetical protein